MSKLILFIMVLFSILGGIDKLMGNRYGMGERFEEGFKSMGGLTMTMVGIISLAPAISQLIMPVISPLSNLTGSDPSVFISNILALDMGGYATSMEIAKTKEMAQYNGLILASMMGATVSFTIPVALNLISKDNLAFFIKGILSGIITIPIGMIIGGISMNIPIKDIWINLIPVVIISLIIAIGLFKFQKQTVKLFNLLGRGIMAISLLGLMLSILDFVLGISIISNMVAFEESIVIVGGIAVILSGAYVFFYVIHEIFQDRLNKISERLGINEFSLLGILTSLSNCIPMLAIYDKMDDKGKTINAAFAVSGAFVFGGQLGYVSGISHDIVMPFVLAKLSAGVCGILLAKLLVNIEEKQEELL